MKELYQQMLDGQEIQVVETPAGIQEMPAGMLATWEFKEVYQ